MSSTPNVTVRNNNLVVVRAGDHSLHEGWLRDPDKNWDLIVNYYGDHPTRFRQHGIVRVDSKGPKWPALKRLLMDWPKLIEGYEYVFFPDDDLRFDVTHLSSLFCLARQYSLWLCQPSLSLGSFVSHSITLHHPAFRCRYSNFVEIMAPCFYSLALRACVDTFDENLSGWGLDSLWPQIVAGVGGHVGIVDAVQMTHTRPVGGPNYVHFQGSVMQPMDELAQLIHKYGLSIIHSVSGGVGADGLELSAEQVAVSLVAQPILPRSMPRSPEWS